MRLNGDDPREPQGDPLRDVSPAEPSDVPPDGRRRPAMVTGVLQTYGSQVAVACLSLLNVLIVARALGVEGRGEVAFVTAIAWLVSNLATFGVQEANVNLAGEQPQTRAALATNSVILALLAGAFALASVELLVVLVPAAGGGIDPMLLAATMATMPLLILSIYLRFLIQGDYGFGVTSVAWALPSVVNVTVNGGLALLGVLTVGSAVATWLAGQVCALALLVWHVMRQSTGFGRPDVALARQTLAFGIRSHWGRIMLIANYRLDTWLLGAIAGAREVGQYSVAVAWAEALFLLPTSLAAVQRPDIVRASPREAVRLTERVFRASLVITLPMAIGLIVLAPFLCAGIFGEEFRGAVIDLRVLAAGAFGVVALKQIGNALTGRQRPMAASLSISAAFVLTVILDFVLIPGHGSLGAAMASTIAYTAGGVVISLVFARTLGGRARDLIPRPGDVTTLWTWGMRVVRTRSSTSGP